MRRDSESKGVDILPLLFLRMDRLNTLDLFYYLKFTTRATDHVSLVRYLHSIIIVDFFEKESRFYEKVIKRFTPPVSSTGVKCLPLCIKIPQVTVGVPVCHSSSVL